MNGWYEGARYKRRQFVPMFGLLGLGMYIFTLRAFGQTPTASLNEVLLYTRQLNGAEASYWHYHGSCTDDLKALSEHTGFPLEKIPAGWKLDLTVKTEDWVFILTQIDGREVVVGGANRRTRHGVLDPGLPINNLSTFGEPLKHNPRESVHGWLFGLGNPQGTTCCCSCGAPNGCSGNGAASFQSIPNDSCVFDSNGCDYNYFWCYWTGRKANFFCCNCSYALSACVSTPGATCGCQ